MKAEGHSFSVAAIWFRLAFVLLSMLAVGCKPKIGEDCATSTDCSFAGDRLCDVTQPGGYCTVFNCEPNLCPAEASCVAFSEGTCSTAAVSTRFRRTFCMRTCEDDSDCRGGSYKCLDLSQDPSRRIVDSNAGGRRVCILPSLSSPPPTSDPPSEPAVCFPSDASFDVSRPETGPALRDASSEDVAPDTSTTDDAGDRGEANGAETGDLDATIDAGDSSRSETGNDAADDAGDTETDSDDAASEPVDVISDDVTGVD